MNIQIVSDLHLEKIDPDIYFKIPPCAENIIIAGDLCHRLQFGEVTNKFLDMYDHVIFVPGNHDYYGFDIPSSNAFFKSFETDRFHVLLEDVIDIDGVKIAGTPLWFTKPKDPIVELNIKGSINDFNYIRNYEADVYTRNSIALEFLRQRYDDNDGIDIVVTHFLPTRLSIAEQYKNDIVNDFFVCPILDYIKIPTKYWVHGHTHESFDYEYGDTRIICNPYGYCGSNKSFCKKVITIE